MSLQEIQDLAEDLIYQDAERDQAFEFYEKTYHNFWELPASIKELPWVAKIVDSSPYDAINTGMRLLSALPFDVEFQPLAPGTANKKRADMIERVLKWQMAAANRRRTKSIESDVVLSALLYDAIALEVIDLPYAIAQKQLVNADTRREQTALSFGRFMVKTHSPRNVHVLSSGLMPEALVCIEMRHAKEVIKEFGSLATGIPGFLELASKPHSDDWVTVFDYWDTERRAVWCAEGKMGNIPESTHSESMVIIPESKLATKFIPWVANMGGSTLESEVVHKYKPILYPLFTTGMWEILNLVESLFVSEVIAHSGSPRYVETGPNIQEAEINMLDPTRKAKMPVGNELMALVPPGIDVAMTNIDALLAAKIDKATVSRILQGGEIPAGIAFATLNLATQTAVGVLKNSKDLSEKSLAEAMTLMLLWTHFTKEPLLGYSTAKKDKGSQMIVRPEEIAPDGIYITATLHPDDVLDRQQRVNTAALAVRELGLSTEKGLEDCGWSDPQSIIKERIKEGIVEHILEMRKRKDLMELEASITLKTQAAMAQLQQSLQLQAAEAQAELQQQQGEQGMSGPDLSTLPPPPQFAPGKGFQEQRAGLAAREGGGVRGFGAAPNMGGRPPAEFAPEETREMVSGQEILGNKPGAI